MNKNIIILIICLAILPMVIALPNKIVYKHEPILLAEGYNGVGIVTNYSTLVKGDFNISLVNDSTSGELNLLGMSFVTPNGKCKKLSSLTFWNSNGDSLNYEDAKTNNWIDAIEFTENLETEGIVEEFEKLCPYEAIWIKSYLAVNMTIENVYGSPHETFDWEDLRFSNGTDELNIGDARTEGWFTSDINFWTGSAFNSICGNLEDCDSLGPLNSWQGYFFQSSQPNIYLLTNNETKQNKVKVKCYGKFVGDNKVCKMPKTFAKYVGDNKVSLWKQFNSHIIRLIGSLRKTKG